MKSSVRSRFQPVLDRYAVLLAHGYPWPPDRGHLLWQGLVAAKDLRDYYTHLDVRAPRAIAGDQVLQFMESILLAMIWPSCALRRTLLLGIYGVYAVWELLHRYVQSSSEQPFFMKWSLDEPYFFHCNFENVDPAQFPSRRDEEHYGRIMDGSSG